MRFFRFPAMVLICLLPMLVSAQRDSSRNDFMNAESWFLFEDYAEAEPIYQNLLKWYPGNDNLKYKIGICLLNDPYRKDQSIRYLLDASRNINPDYKENSFKEETAPPDVLYYLGSAYLVNELLDKAIETFSQFLEILDPEVYDEELVRAQIQACENAKRLKSMPVDIDLRLLDSTINTRYPDIHPVISGDGNRMAFITKQPFFDEALFVEKIDGQWTLPMSITSMLGFDMDIYPVALNYDGTEMLLYYDDELIGNLYHAEFEDGFWQRAKKLGDPISTKYWESHGCFSKDGKTLYFTSNRKGTNGGLDIYQSEKQPDGSWGSPVNLGPKVNSRFNEETPFISEDGNTLYFSSYGHYNIGGYDIFYSRKNKDGSWGDPVNMGYPINTTDDDLFFMPVENGEGAYYSIYSPVGRGRHDLYFMDIYSVDNPRLYLVTGRLRAEDGNKDLTRTALYVIDTETGDTVMTVPVDASGDFSMNLKQGIYNLHFKGTGYEELIRPLRITRDSDKTGITLEDDLALVTAVKPPEIYEGEESQIETRDTIFDGMAGETITIPLRLRKGSTLIVKTIKDSLLVSADTIPVEKRRTDLEIVPLPGESTIELEMIDSYGNIHKKRLTVEGKVPAPPEPVEEEQEPVEEAEPGPEEADRPDPVRDMAEAMIRESDGALKESLLRLDLTEEGVSTRRELIDHLYQQTDTREFSSQDVDLVVSEVLSGGNVNRLHDLLLEYADGPLKEYLELLDPEQEAITTPEELLEHLRMAGREHGFTMEDVREALKKSVDPVGNTLDKMQEEAGDDLQDFLGTIDPGKLHLHTKRDLFEYLYKQSDLHEFTREEIDTVLAAELAGDDARMLYQLMLENAEGPLKEYLEGLDLEKEGITSPDELLEHLREAGADHGFTMEDVRKAMLDALGKPLEADRMFTTLQEKSGGALNEFISEVDLRRAGIYDPKELFEYLYNQAEIEGYPKVMVDHLLTDELVGRDAKMLYQLLLENAEGPLRLYLEKIDMESGGITTPAALLEHLRNVGEENGFTAEDIRQAMLRALENPLEVERIYEELLGTTDGVIREILGDLDLRGEGIYDVEDLAEALYQALLERGYSEKEINEILSELFPGLARFRGGTAGKVALWGGIGAVVLMLVIILLRRRKKQE